MRVASGSSLRGAARRVTPLLLGALAAAALLAMPLQAGAYCRTTVCSDARAGASCTPPQATDCGMPVFWRNGCIGYSVQRDASVQVPLDSAEAIVAQAFASWTQAACPAGGSPGVVAVNLGPVSCDAREYNQLSGNANLIVFRDEAWPYAGAGSTLALTTVTFNLDDGEIFDTDLEINSADLTLTTSDTAVQYDLLSIVTHEVGHLLGLAHSPDTEATMYIEYAPGDISLRTLEPDDVAGICAAYPGAPPGDCTGTPRHGFADGCGEDAPPPDDDGCSYAAQPAGGADGLPSTRWGASLLTLASVAIARRRRRRQQAR